MPEGMPEGRKKQLDGTGATRHGLMNIGEASLASGVSARMIRHYESIGLMPKARRTDSNYRVYTAASLHTLQFIRRARALGFSVRQISTLLDLWQDQSRNSSEVRELALRHVAELDAKAHEIQAMSNTLKELARRCVGDERPDCPILEDLAQGRHAD